LVRACLERLAYCKRVKCWKAHTGGAKFLDKNGKAQFVRFGYPGQADITGLDFTGARLEIECKTGSGTPSERQKDFRAMIESMNGRYSVVRSLSDLEAIVREIEQD
jgi:hypothetical protein